MDNQQGPLVEHREFCSTLYGSLDGREVCRGWWVAGTDTCICMTESLCWASEIITTLLIRYPCMLSCLVVSDFTASWIAPCQVALSIGLSRQEEWSGLPFPPPGDLSDPGIEPASQDIPCIGRQILYP